METVLISGGTGLIGRQLGKKLIGKGYDVALLSRSARYDEGVNTYFWDPDKQEIDREAIINADYIIHLAGAGLGEKRWTKKRRREITDSRVKTGQLIHDKLMETKRELKAFISASAIGYYGAITSDRIFLETDPPASDFSGETCRLWEETADRFEDSGIRVVKIRQGIVLSGDGGALVKMAAPVKMGIGSAIGSGNQYLPWIHIDDLCSLFINAIEDPGLKGAFNATAPDYVTYREFIRTLARILGKPLWIPAIPSFVMKLIFGEMAEILLKGSRVSSEKIIAAGFRFKFPDLEGALKDLYQSK
jgi:uncharacterized protein (TIGR01777 family)